MRNPIQELQTKELLFALREDPRYQAVLAEVSLQRPTIPRFEPQRTTEENDALVEKIKFFSAQQKGFDLLYMALTGQQL